MKSIRHGKILEIIENRDVETQEDLIAILKENGFDVTQATVSRDIRELNLTKIMTGAGQYKYVLNKPAKNNEFPAYRSSISASILSVDYAGNIVVIKTYPGLAQALAAVLDGSHIKSVLGCVAGDDTIFVAIRDASKGYEVASEIKKLSEN
ncbi:MAG: arginine repressor [Clostridia bacterium]|nr:arginine repressor [Clostridia bacterium]